jgi:peptide deformylase
VAARKILIYPNPVLRKPNIEVTDFEGISELVEDMLDTVELDGAALAANQVGAKERLFVISTASNSLAKIAANVGSIFINPQIISASEETSVENEGCLSFPGVVIPVLRHVKVTVSAQGINGDSFSIEATGFEARVMQHEIDHLDGKLFIDALSTGKRLEIARRLTKK